MHLRQYVVCRKIDAATPQPAQRFKPAEFMQWVLKQKQLARRVVCCYEAGPFGYTLQRELEADSITCHVVRPQDWDRHGSKVKTDGRDARELAEHLARYEAGNKHALAVVLPGHHPHDRQWTAAQPNRARSHGQHRLRL